MPTENWFMQIAEHLGIPMAILAVFAWAVWHWVNRSAAWLAPRIDKVVDATAANVEGIKVLDVKADMNHDVLKLLVLDVQSKCEAILRALDSEKDK